MSNELLQNLSFTSGDVMIDLAHGEVCHRDGRHSELSARKTALLACLARKFGFPVSRGEILAQVWQLDPNRTVTRTIDMHISLLRKKLGDMAHTSAMLRTVHGVGYMLCRNAGPSTK